MSIASEHPPEDVIVLHAYGEGAPDERDVVSRHLVECAACRLVAEECGAFRELSTMHDDADPGPDFEARIWTRIVADLPEPRRTWTSRHALTVTAWAATIALVILAGTWWFTPGPGGPGPGPLAETAGSQPHFRERVLFSALDAHLGQTEMFLVELMNAPEATASLEFEREVADDLVHSGRLYRATATETGHGPFAAVLDEVEPVLLEVARARHTLAAADLAALRERIVTSDLLFKVRVAARGARDRQSDAGDL